MSVDLSRYLVAQKKDYTVIYGQIMMKTYDSGWIEWVFPRYLADCNSEKSKFYGLTSEKEAKAFWKTKLLKNNYLAMLRAISYMTKEEYMTIFSDRGRLKIRQSLDIFITLAENDDLDAIKQFIEKFY